MRPIVRLGIAVLFLIFQGSRGMAHEPVAPLIFDHACDAGESHLVIGAVGDIVPYKPLQDQAKSNPSGFRSLWRRVEGLLRNADITYANLEGPVADGYPLGGYPSFNFDVRLLADLKAAGIGIVSNANNHAMDRGSGGLDRTIRNLLQQDLPFAGTRPSRVATRELKEEFGYQPSWYTVVESKGFRTAWLACTYGLNQEIDEQHQVLNCYDDQELLLGMIRDLTIRGDIDAVLVAPHWGIQYEYYPRKDIQDLARKFLEAGALGVLGAHPHVLQPIEKFVINGKERVVAYSLGDFLSGNPFQERRTTSVLYLGLTKGKGGSTWINGVRYVPIHLVEDQEGFSLEPMDRVAAPQKSRDIIERLFSPWNELPSGDPLVTNPQCD